MIQDLLTRTVQCGNIHFKRTAIVMGKRKQLIRRLAAVCTCGNFAKLCLPRINTTTTFQRIESAATPCVIKLHEFDIGRCRVRNCKIKHGNGTGQHYVIILWFIDNKLLTVIECVSNLIVFEGYFGWRRKGGICQTVVGYNYKRVCTLI